MKKPPSAPKVPAAPAVPSFGAPLPLPPKPSNTVPPVKNANDKKRVSLFGLTSEGSIVESAAEKSENEEEDEVDEEAAYASNISSGPYVLCSNL